MGAPALAGSDRRDFHRLVAAVWACGAIRRQLRQPGDAESPGNGSRLSEFGIERKWGGV